MRSSFMKRTILAGLVAALVASLGGLALADGPGPRPAKKTQAAQKQEQKAIEQRYGQTGEISLAGGTLRLNVPATYYFLPAPEARAHLQRIGAPAPAGEVHGMVAPSGTRPIDDGFWGAVISTNPLGHVAEERADRFAATDFIDEVRGARAAPAPRVESFASPPIHDASRHLTTWTERYAGAATARTIRNEQRLLGKSAVAGVTIDARAGQMTSVAAAAPEIGRMLSFTSGNAYADYRAGTDPAALYDLPSLLTLKTKPATVAAQPLPAPTSSGTPQAGIPAQSSGLQPVNGGDAPATAVGAGDIQRWLPWIGGGLVALAIIPWLVGLLSRRRAAAPARERRAPREERPAADPNITPTE
jgi:uncharacterized membrane-anchored protein